MERGRQWCRAVNTPVFIQFTLINHILELAFLYLVLFKGRGGGADKTIKFLAYSKLTHNFQTFEIECFRATLSTGSD